MGTLPCLTETSIDKISRCLADAVTHKELSLLLSQCDIEEQDGTPKWERMLLALSHRQKRDRCGNNVIAFFCAVLHPSRFADRHENFEDFRTETNYQLSFYGMAIDEKGEVRQQSVATTIDEAQERANELRSELVHRNVHHDVLRFCKAELLRDNYFHCVLEATKSIAQKIRDKTGLQMDGAALVERAFSVKGPVLALNTLQTESEQSEQRGFANLLKGVFGTFRNVTAHAPRVHWAVDRAEAMDALTILSYLHRRVDNAVVVPGGDVP